MIKFVYIDDDGCEIELELPATKEVCSRCSGKGKIVNPAIDGNGLSREDFEEDPDFKEDYMSGMYDIVCPTCNGTNVIDVVDEDRADQELLKKYYDIQKEDLFIDEIAAMERRYGA